MNLSEVSIVPKKDHKYTQYPANLDEYIYEIANLIDNNVIDEDNKEHYIRMYTDKLRELGETDERREYYRDLFQNLKKMEDENRPLHKKCEASVVDEKPIFSNK